MSKSLSTLSLCLSVSLLLCLLATLPLGLASDDVVVRPVEKTLSSGMKALLWPRAGSGTVLIAVTVPAGSQDENPEMAGLSHYLEHLLFDGFDDLDERGVTEAFEGLSAYMNAFTREQSTVFFSLTPREEAVAAAELMVGMLTRSTIQPGVYAKEKKVILEELAKDHARPDGLKEELLRASLWAGTPKEHPVGGTIATVEATTREEVVRYFKTRYQPGAFRVLLTGDLDIGGLEAVLAPFAAFEESKPGAARPDPLSWPGWGRWVALAPPKSEAPKMPPGMGGMPKGMMGAMGGHGGRGDGGTLEIVIAAPDALDRKGNEMELVARWLSEATGPLASALVPTYANSVEVARVPEDPRDSLDLRISAKEGVEAGVLLSRALGALGAAAAGPADGDVLRMQRAWEAERAITGQRLHYAAVYYGDALATTRGSLADALEPRLISGEETRSAATALLKGAASRTRAAWLGKGGPVEASDLPQPLAPEVKATARALEAGPMGSLVSTLPNGMVVGILPETGSPVFGVHLLVADRSLNEPAESPGIADLIHRLLPAGTMLSGSTALASRFERAGIDVKAADSPMIPFDNRYHTPSFSYLRIEGPSVSLEDSLEMLAEMIRQPAWDARGWEQATKSHLASRKAGNRGGSRAARVFRQALFGENHPLARAVSGTPDAALPSEDEVRAAWGEYPGGYFAPNRLILTIASPLPAEQVLAVVGDLFSSEGKSDPVRGPYPAPAGSGNAPSIALGETPQVTVLWGRLVSVAPEDRAALAVAADALSDRMVAVIREEKGLAYGLGAGAGMIPGGQWILSASVGTRPDNKDEVVSALEGLVAELSAKPIGQKDLDRLVNRDRRTHMLRSLSAASRAYRVGRVLFEGPDSELLIDDAQYARVTPEEVQRAMKKYFVPAKMLLVVAP